VPWAVLDTNVYIGFWERGLYDEAITSVGQKFVVRYSAVVFSELRRGARTLQARRRVATLAERATVVWAPLVSDWWEAGRLIQKVGDGQEWERSKRRDFQNDALIALTARRHGATVVTANRLEFELLSREIGIAVLGV
jgi:predicted nucleic acid-binding protein